jgi:hypothetical protein
MVFDPLRNLSVTRHRLPDISCLTAAMGRPPGRLMPVTVPNDHPPAGGASARSPVGPTGDDPGLDRRLRAADLLAGVLPDDASTALVDRLAAEVAAGASPTGWPPGPASTAPGSVRRTPASTCSPPPPTSGRRSSRCARPTCRSRPATSGGRPTSPRRSTCTSRPMSRPPASRTSTLATPPDLGGRMARRPARRRHRSGPHRHRGAGRGAIVAGRRCRQDRRRPAGTGPDRYGGRAG